MAKIAIIGSSFSESLYCHKHEKELQKLPHNKRIYRRTHYGSNMEFDGIPVEDDRENHWVNMLSNKYEQHTFHIFAKGGSGWEYAQQLLYMLSNDSICDRVIIELQSYRAMILSDNIPFNLLSDHVVFSDYSILYETPNTLVKWYHLLYRDWGFTHIEPSSHHFSYDKLSSLMKNKYQLNSNNSKLNFVNYIARYLMKNKYQLNSNNSKLNFTNEVVDYIARMIVSPAYIIRYQQYLLSLTSVWPKIFDRVGIWAFEPFDLPYLTNFNVNKEFFNNKIQCFDETVMEEWVRKDPINNSIDSWKNKYFGFDGYHLNKEGMELLVDFLLKQPNIQKVLE